MTLTIACLILVFFSDQLISQEKGFTSKKFGNIIYLDIPDYMSKTFGLNDIAKVQYANAEKEAYTIIIEEDKEDIKSAGGGFANPQEYFKFFMDSFGIDSIQIISEVLTKSGKFQAYQGLVDGVVQDMNLFYLITIIESPTHFYNVISWTLKENQDKLINDFKKIASSLKE
jgi:hypothetical protein